MIETRWDQSLGEDERSSVWRTPMLSKTLRTLKTFSRGMLWRDFVWFGWVCLGVFFSNAEARNGKHGRLKSSYQGLISLTINLIITLINTSISLMIALIITLIITLISAITTFIKIFPQRWASKCVAAPPVRASRWAWGKCWQVDHSHTNRF